MLAAAIWDFYVMWNKNVSNYGLDKDYLHQISQDNALDTGLYNSLYYHTIRDHLFSQSER